MEKVNQKRVVIHKVTHRGEAVLCLGFERDLSIEAEIKKLANCRWSQTMRCWYIPDSPTNFRAMLASLRPLTYVDFSAVVKNNEDPALPVTKEKKEPQRQAPVPPAGNTHVPIKKFEQWMKSKRYSSNTIKTYSDALKTFLRYHAGKAVAEITQEDLIRFNNDYILKNNYSASYQNQVVNALKLFFGVIENRSLDPELIHRPKRGKVLPNVLSKEEVKRIVESLQNVKHRAMLSLIYACGLRSGELITLKPEHIDSKRMLLIVKRAKGNKDRIVPLSAKIIELLRHYYKACRPKIYLFEGQKAGVQYDSRSLQQVLKQAIAKAGIKKPVTLHWLRHSYATHLLEGGTDLRYIQEILGHSSSKTTEIYTHVSTKSIQKINSPFDTL